MCSIFWFYVQNCNQNRWTHQYTSCFRRTGKSDARVSICELQFSNQWIYQDPLCFLSLISYFWQCLTYRFNQWLKQIQIIQKARFWCNYLINRSLCHQVIRNGHCSFNVYLKWQLFMQRNHFLVDKKGFGQLCSKKQPVWPGPKAGQRAGDFRCSAHLFSIFSTGAWVETSPNRWSTNTHKWRTG